MSDNRPYVLLTGATGMVGAQLLARLLRRHVPVLVLARAKGRLTANDRIEIILSRFESAWHRRLPRPVIVTGELTRPGLGLSDADQDMVRRCCGSVVHSAASLSFRPAAESPENEPFRTNLGGTGEILKLCEIFEIRQIHYVSTAYVCGTRIEPALEDDLDVGQSFANDYERSKVEAERLLRNAERIGCLTVYRPSIVIDSQGRSPFTQDRTIYGAFSLYRALSTKFGLPENGQWFRNLGFVGSERKNLVEVEWVADVIDRIIAEPTLHGETYHLTDAQGTSIDEIESAFHQVATQLSNEARQLLALNASAVTLAGNNSHPRDGHLENSARLNRDLIDAIAAPYVQTFMPYFKDDPEFDRRNLVRALAKLGCEDHQRSDSSTVSRLARVQLDHVRPAVTLGNGSSRTNDVAELLIPRVGTRCLSQIASADGHLRPQSASDWGVQITGPHGGDWRLEPSDLRLSPAGQLCRQRLYCDASTWNELVRRTMSVEQAIAIGRLSIEFEPPLDSQNCVDELESMLRKWNDMERANNDPIIHDSPRGVSA